MSAIVEHSDCRAYLATLATNSLDACTTDPPYELNFMGREWDRSGIANQVELWREVYRVLKPGAHLVVFGGTRTYHRMVCAIEDAGFEIRDSLHWLYGSGFPKSHDVSKALDKAAGAERAVVGTHRNTGLTSRPGWRKRNDPLFAGDTVAEPYQNGTHPITAPATDLAARWAGWGTALKPAHEPIVLARKPLAKTVAATIAAYGTGGINVEACLVATNQVVLADRIGGSMGYNGNGKGRIRHNGDGTDNPAGRWPPNLLLSHSASCNGHCAPDCPVAALDRQSAAGGIHSAGGARKGVLSKGDFGIGEHGDRERISAHRFGDTGGASRFYPILNYDPAYDDPFLYCAKASKKERNAGCAGLPEQLKPRLEGDTRPCHMADGKAFDGRDKTAVANHHPTVKPVALCRWLVRLVTPLGGTALDPFAGSGSFGVACVLEGRHYKGCDQDAEYVEIANRRIAATQPALLGV